jgi:hypothetical protein
MDEKQQSFSRSRVPVEYRKETSTLTGLGEHGEKILDFIKLDGLKKISTRGVIVEVVGKSAISRDVFYLTARAFILHSISVRCVYSLDLLRDRMTDELREELDERGVLFVDRLGCDGEAVFSKRDAFEIEVFLEKWISSGRSLVFRSEVVIDKNVQWSESFRFFVKNRLKKSVIVG